MTRFNSRWHEILFKFPKFSRFFTNFRGFSWISAVVTSGVLKTGSNLTPLDAIHTETEQNQYKYLYIPHFSLSFSLSTMWKRRGSDRERAVLHNKWVEYILRTGSRPKAFKPPLWSLDTIWIKPTTIPGNRLESYNTHRMLKEPTTTVIQRAPQNF